MIELDVTKNFSRDTGRDGTGLIIKISCGTGRDETPSRGTRDGTGRRKVFGGTRGGTEQIAEAAGRDGTQKNVVPPVSDTQLLK